MEVFTFNDIGEESIQDYVEMALVFNMTRPKIEKERISLASFHDEKLGSAEERIDVLSCKDNTWKILDLKEKLDGYNEFPLGYLIFPEEYDKIIVILRRMSTMILDKKKESISVFMYNPIAYKYRSLDDNPSMLGLLAKNRIVLDDSDEMWEKIKSCKDSDIIEKWLKSLEKEVVKRE